MVVKNTSAAQMSTHAPLWGRGSDPHTGRRRRQRRGALCGIGIELAVGPIIWFVSLRSLPGYGGHSGDSVLFIPEEQIDLPKSIGAPATRALVGAGFTSLGQLDGVSAQELTALHGFGPKALPAHPRKRSNNKVNRSAECFTEPARGAV